MLNGDYIGSCRECIVGWKNFRYLTEDQLNYANENRYEAGFKAGEIMIKQGSPSQSALFLSKGLAKIYFEDHKGKNFIVDIAKTGELILGPGAFVNSRHSFTVSAITPANACFISFEALSHLIRVNPQFAVGMLEDLSAKSLKMNERIMTLAHKRMSGRLADALLYFSLEIFGTDSFDMLLSRQELGEFTNMAKECAVRIIREFEESGMIRSEGSKITILDRARLSLLSEKG